MNYTFSRVAAFCGLRLSYYSTAGLLVLIFLLLIPTEYQTPTPIYILFSMAVPQQRTATTISIAVSLPISTAIV